MRIAAVSTVKDEADIINATISHLYNEGVANIYIADGMSTDGTRDILAAHPVKVYDDDSPIHRQPYWIARLAEQAYEDGADWVIPFDADEFWVPVTFNTLAQVFEAIPADVGKLYASMFHHYTWDERELTPKPLPKVAFRAQANVVVKNGNHEVDVSGGSVSGRLEVRELQYRGEDHFVRKVRERNATLDPALPPGEGTHHSRFLDYTDEQLREWWRADHPIWGDRRNIVTDPIPSQFRVGICTTAS